MKWFLFDHRFQIRRENVENVLGPSLFHPASPFMLDGSPDWCHDNLAGRIRYYPSERMYKGRVTGNEGIYSPDGIAWKRGKRWLDYNEIPGDPDLDPARRYKAVVHVEGPDGSPNL